MIEEKIVDETNIIKINIAGDKMQGCWRISKDLEGYSLVLFYGTFEVVLLLLFYQKKRKK